MNLSPEVWSEFWQSDMFRYLLYGVAAVILKLVGIPSLLVLLLAGVGVGLGVVELPGSAGGGFQSYISGWYLIALIAFGLGMVLFKRRGVLFTAPLFLIFGALSALNFFKPAFLPEIIGDRAASLSVLSFAICALCGATIAAVRSAGAAVVAVLWLVVAVGFNGEGILRCLPGTWFKGQLRSLVVSEENSGISEELPRFAMRSPNEFSELSPRKPVGVVSRSRETGELIAKKLSASGGYQPVLVHELNQLPSHLSDVWVDLDSVLRYPSAACQPSAIAALIGVTPVCKEEYRGPGIVCVGAPSLAQNEGVFRAGGVSCDRVVGLTEIQKQEGARGEALLRK